MTLTSFKPMPLSMATGHTLAFFAGALLTLGFSPVDFWPATLIAMAYFSVSLIELNKWQAFFRGWLFGTGAFLAGAWWVYVSMQRFGYMSVGLSGLMTFLFALGLGLFFAIQALIQRHFNSVLSLAIGFPSLWLLFEWVRTWFLTGFPWLFSGYAFLDTWLEGWAPIGSVLLVSFFVALLSVCLGILVLQLMRDRYSFVPNIKHPMNIKLYAIMISITVMSFALQSTHWVNDSDRSIKALLAQGNIPQERKWQPDFLIPTMDRYHGLSYEYWNDVDVVIWPEAAIPLFRHEAWYILQQLEKQAAATNTTFITGILSQINEPNREPYYYNSILAMGNGSGTYYKQRLVPFGEYIPLGSFTQKWLPFLDFLPSSSISKGSPDQAGLIAGTTKLAPFICYEIVYPGLVRHYAKNSDAIITISNDAWFGRSTGPWQHFQMARMRALETGKPLLRATNTGVTAFVDTRGDVISIAPQFELTQLVHEVKLSEGETPFMRIGLLPFVLISAILLALGLLLSKRTNMAKAGGTKKDT